MKCPNCGADNADSARFCLKCGQSIPSAAKRWVPVLLGIVFAFGFLAILLSLIRSKRSEPAQVPIAVAPVPGSPTNGTARVKLGVAYGSEKEVWMKWARDEFAKTPAGAGIDVDLQAKGSLDAANAIVNGNETIHVWSPASAMYKDVFMSNWTSRHGNTDVMLSEAPLAQTPMVLVMWKERYDAYANKYKELTFQSLAEAMKLPGGWNDIAGKSEWGFFKFSFTNPGKSNSGLAALLLMGYDFHNKHRNLSAADLSAQKFVEWVGPVQKNLVGAASGLETSTGFLMTKMIQRGPSTYDAVMVYESTAIENLQRADGRWGSLQVVYPKFNFWNDNPYYILNVPWSTADHRNAAKAFQDFLLSEPAQRKALELGFRPADTNVATNTPDSPLVKYAPAGLRQDLPGTFCEPPKADVIEALLLSWQRSQ
jgi:ABC-type Fe3+ transport system substrate-binding protein